MINGPYFDPSIPRIQPVDNDPSSDEQEERKQRRAHYQGRSWHESEEELRVQPSIPTTPSPIHRRAAGVYANRELVERAHAFMSQLTTLEEKVAQLCMLETEAIYDAALQHEVELQIQTWQIGGVFFKRGNYKRQAYLIERFQEVSKTPLLMSNDFLHGLSFYLQGDELPSGPLSEQRFLDLGKAIMVQNRRLGVHIQFDRERYLHKIPMSDEQAKAFRKGIRHAQGIVGKEKGDKRALSAVSALLSMEEGAIASSKLTEGRIQETIGFKTLTFFDASQRTSSLEEPLFEAYGEGYDVYLFTLDNIASGVRTLCKLVRSGKISEEEINRRVLKTLILKSLFFK